MVVIHSCARFHIVGEVLTFVSARNTGDGVGGKGRGKKGILNNSSSAREIEGDKMKEKEGCDGGACGECGDGTRPPIKTEGTEEGREENSFAAYVGKVVGLSTHYVPYVPYVPVLCCAVGIGLAIVVLRARK
jgi:hypothetical protein